MSEENNDGLAPEEEGKIRDVIPVSGMYESWFLDYASYVILERAVPAIEDGFKPVQRRILHSMKEMDDGRFNKVANIIGQTMQYHPHGDASIGDAMVHIGQKDLLIETQGNWGDIRTGDRAAAARYIEARLSKFALEVVFNPQTTDWQLSYDGRKKEPVTLPVKFPLLLAQGVEGIAVGLSTKILPHNFIELIQASIKVLQGKKPKIYPDFPTGGMADFSEYNEGRRGGKVKVRAVIEEHDKKTLVIKDIPFGTTTTGLIDSIIKANDKGKIKVKKVIDNTAEDVEILVELASGQSPNITIDALYAFTDCETSISPNACVIIDDKPHFVSVNDMLRVSTEKTVDLLRQELEIRKAELLEKILFSSLEKIFIENRIYRDIEECETWEAVIDTIDKGLDPFKKQFYREITHDDITRLTEIKIKRISRFDAFKADELMKRLEEELSEVEHNLANLIDYAIAYFERLKEKYGKDRERKTEIKSFENIAATVVAANNAKLYVNRKEGFIGYGLKRDEFVSECSDIDDIIVFRADGKFQVVRISDKIFVGKDILWAGVFKKNDERKVYNMMYLDGKSGRTMVKRFQVLGVTRDREYDLTKGERGSKVLYFTANPNGEAELVTVYLTSGAKARVKVFDFNFADIEIKGRGAGGNIVTKYPVRKVQLKMEGKSTLGGLDIWYDESVGRLNRDQRGELLGNFQADDMVLVIYNSGEYELTSFDLTNRYEPAKIHLIEKFNPEGVISVIHYDASSAQNYVKRFQVETSTRDKKFLFINEEKGSKLQLATTLKDAQIEVHYTIKGSRERHKTVFDMDMLIDVKGWRANGNRLSPHNVKKVVLLDGKKVDVNVEDAEAETAEVSEEQEAVVEKTPEAPITVDEKPKEEKVVPEVEKPVQEKPEKKEAPKPKSDGKKPGSGEYNVGDTIELF
ncbi:DNA gyrase/topoisomerase IV subunit A [Roseivirga misakiensis]|uniref:DNA topoisomerase IV n=1 Tax=Roseivirga misakiensis TaxID=1563681 RepID=A0A1E5SZB8_9BACT|nr:DNA gyrase/topoisomerase IV subunit A [Roseivirga misakiensis]OEK04461.1 DNA topoisomerase IV [Roseivirga misakiensis]